MDAQLQRNFFVVGDPCKDLAGEKGLRVISKFKLADGEKFKIVLVIADRVGDVLHKFI
jgi:hypothetical protein